jgi:penicillin amidase
VLGLNRRAAALFAIAATLLAVSAATPASAVNLPVDRAHAVNVVPPGQSGTFNLATFAAVTGGASSRFGPNFADQLPLYANWKYKPFQFEQTGAGSHPGNRADVTVYRDTWGVPQVYAASENAMVYGLGYTMAQDRLFQMEAFRHVGHGTLAELTGSDAIPMDEQTRRVSEGEPGRTAELAAAPQSVRDEADSFTAGINQAMTEMCGPSILGVHSTYPAFVNTCPAEFTLLNDAPADWTNDDTLAFGEYAGRNFGEFDVGELTAAQSYLSMVTKLGQPAAEKAFSDLYALDVPEAPHIVPDSSGLFPRTPGTPVPGVPANGSQFINHTAAALPSHIAVTEGVANIDAKQQLINKLKRQLGIPRFGSNAIVVSGSRTQSGNPIIYSGPQTGWAVPGFFWEVEVHDPVRDTRGVTVPTIPLLVIGRNADSAWSVTSALDANATTFDDVLNSGNSTYQHNGQTLPVTTRTETIKCHNPPSEAAVILGGSLPPLCPLTNTSITVYTTVHGPGVADPTSDHHLFTRETSVDHNFVKTLMAWDDISKAHTAADFGAALSNHYLGFNFFYADARGEIAYFNTGRYPIYPSNVDPNLPLPGTGEYDWQGLEPYARMPHAINPAQGYLVNWNNKPGHQWWSPGQVGSTWGADHQVVDLDHVVAARRDWTLETLGQAPRQVAYTDNRARNFVPYLVQALSGTADPTLQTVRQLLAAYDFQRTDRGGGNYGPATTFFDRWYEFLVRDVFLTTMDQAACGGFAHISCANPPGHFVSTDNLGAPAHKFDSNAGDALLRAFRGEASGPINQYTLLPANWAAASLTAADEAKAYLTGLDGANPAGWTEPMEVVSFGAQGAGSVPDYGPLQNRGSYGQVVEPLAVTPLSGGPTTLPNTGTGIEAALLLGLAGATIAAGVGRRRARGKIRA